MSTRKPTAAQITAAFSLIFAQTGIKEGDKVKVIRWPTEQEVRHFDTDLNYVQEHVNIGEEYEVAEITPEGEVYLEVYLDDDCCLPFTCLEKIGESNKVYIGDGCYDAEVAEDGKTVEVGCQEITFEQVEKVYNKMKVNQEDYAKKNPRKPIALKAR